MRRGISVGTIAVAVVLAMSGSASLAASGAGEFAPVCSHALPDAVAGCQAVQLLDPSANWHGYRARGAKGASGRGSTFAGYFPAELRAAYGLTEASATNGAGQTVAIVDAYDDPKAESDLAAYRAHFGLAPCAASTGCFTKVNQLGESAHYPTANTSWSEEISLDLDMVSAICSNCRILLVEASSASLTNLGTAVAYATAHANAVSNSYGASEFSGEAGYDHYYAHAGVAITASAGDSGYGVEYPAASPFVTAVGGTTLTKAANPRGWSEAVWSGTGSGCSALEPNPGWQPVTSLCTRRTVADTAADANPGTGVAVYDSYGEPGWMVFGGTSVSAPIIASVYALAGNTSSFALSASGSDAAKALYSQSAPPALNKVLEGANTRRCSVYLCNAAFSLLEDLGYNAPTGAGTPNGLVGF